MQDDQIIGELREFKRATLDELKSIKYDMKSLSNNMNELNKFKWKLAGSATALNVVIIFIVEIFHYLNFGQ